MVLVVLVAAMLAMSTHTELSLSPVAAIGVATPVTVRLANPHGVRTVDAWLEQDGKRYPLFAENGAGAPSLLETARGAAARDLRSGQEQSAGVERGQSAVGGGGRVERPARQHRFGSLGRQTWC